MILFSVLKNLAPTKHTLVTYYAPLSFQMIQLQTPQHVPECSLMRNWTVNFDHVYTDQ